MLESSILFAKFYGQVQNLRSLDHLLQREKSRDHQAKKKQYGYVEQNI